MVKRYTEVFDPNHSQECICHRGPMDRGLEESTEGDFVDIEDYKELKNQLAKANERVKELEQANLELAANVEACCELTDMDMGAAIERLFEIDNTESKALLNKFAIENKIEALKEQLKRKSFKSVHDLIEIIIDSYENQLRKEQE